jgi:caa(3)-type oxidase subunit IV
MSAHEHSHVVPIRNLILNFIVLGVFMILTIAASKWHIGPEGNSLGNNLVAMLIAGTKAVLVILIFMNVKNGSKLVKLYAVSGFVWLILVFTMFSDYMTRKWEPVQGWNPRDETSLPRQPIGQHPYPKGFKPGHELDKQHSTQER